MRRRAPQHSRRHAIVRLLGGVLGGLLVPGCAAPRRGPVSAPSPPPTPILSSEPWTFGAARGRLVRTINYRLFTTLAPSVLSDRLPAFLEGALAEYRSRFGPLPAPPGALETYIVATRAQWSRLTARLVPEHAWAFQTIPRGGLTTGGRAILYDIGPQDTFALAAHEGWHQFTQTTFARPLPTWLDEALATTFEGFMWDPVSPWRALFRPWANLERFEQLRDGAAGGRLVALSRLIAAAPGDLAGQGTEPPLDYYAQIWGLAMFLLEGEGGRYASGLRRLVSDAAAGNTPSSLHLQPPSVVLRAYLTADLAAFEAEYGAFVGRLVRPGAAAFITAGKSPLGGGR